MHSCIHMRYSHTLLKKQPSRVGWELIGVQSFCDGQCLDEIPAIMYGQPAVEDG